LRERLGTRGFGAEVVEGVLAELRKRKLVDDVDFARFWVESRESFSPRSRRLLVMELKGKGVGAEAIGEATAEVDDEESSYRAAQRKCRSWGYQDRRLFGRRLSPLLRRLGFDYQVIAETANRLWREQARTSSDRGNLGEKGG